MPESRPAIHGQIGHVIAVEADGAGIGADQAGDDVEAGRLAGAVGAQQPHRLAPAQRHRDAAQHRALLELLRQAAHDQAAVIVVLFARAGAMGVMDGAMAMGRCGVPVARPLRRLAGVGAQRRDRGARGASPAPWDPDRPGFTEGSVTVSKSRPHPCRCCRRPASASRPHSCRCPAPGKSSPGLCPR